MSERVTTPHQAVMTSSHCQRANGLVSDGMSHNGLIPSSPAGFAIDGQGIRIDLPFTQNCPNRSGERERDCNRSEFKKCQVRV